MKYLIVFAVLLSLVGCSTEKVIDGYAINEQQAIENCIKRNGFDHKKDEPKDLQESLSNYANSMGKIVCSIDSTK